jgi:hypothetical protein
MFRKCRGEKRFVPKNVLSTELAYCNVTRWFSNPNPDNVVSDMCASPEWLTFPTPEFYSVQAVAVSYCWRVVSAFVGFCATCCVLGNCERSHPPPRACTSAMAEVIRCA